MRYIALKLIVVYTPRLPYTGLQGTPEIDIPALAGWYMIFGIFFIIFCGWSDVSWFSHHSPAFFLRDSSTRKHTLHWGFLLSTFQPKLYLQKLHMG